MYVEWYQDVLCHIIIRPTAIHKGSRNYCCIYRFGKLVVILGGFHLLVSYLGAVGFIMGGSVMETLWETVYPHDDQTCIFSNCASSSPDLSRIALNSRPSE